MTWKFDPSKGLEPLSGIPLEADDKTFDAAVAAYEAQFDDRVSPNPEGDGIKTVRAKGSVKLSGIYQHVDDKTVEKEG